MMRRHPVPRFENMTPRLHRLPLVVPAALLGAVLLLTGCSVGVTDPRDASSTGRTGSTSTPRAGIGDIVNGPCDERDLDIRKNGVRLVLDGACGDVTISADDVEVNLDTASSLTVAGDRVQVIVNGDLPTLTLQGDADSVNGEKMGTVTVDGTNGTVLATEITALSSTGSGNTVNWDSGVRSAQDTGTGNTFIGPS